MGMDVYGLSPSSEEGTYFRNNVWWWHPLADYIIQFAPEHLVVQCQSWHSNDGDGLDEQSAEELGDWLEEAIARGHTLQYEQEYKAHLESLPLKTCDLCHGTGIRTDKVGQDMKFPERVIGKEWNDPIDHPRYGQKGYCNGCGGRGTVKDFRANYPFSVENVQEFAIFCRESGGFEIC